MPNNISGLKDGTETLQMCMYVLIFHRNAYQSKVVKLNYSNLVISTKLKCILATAFTLMKG